jgi:hypothetical protein
MFMSILKILEMDGFDEMKRICWRLNERLKESIDSSRSKAERSLPWSETILAHTTHTFLLRSGLFRTKNVNMISSLHK